MRAMESPSAPATGRLGLGGALSVFFFFFPFQRSRVSAVHPRGCRPGAFRTHTRWDNGRLLSSARGGVLASRWILVLLHDEHALSLPVESSTFGFRLSYFRPSSPHSVLSAPRFPPLQSSPRVRRGLRCGVFLNVAGKEFMSMASLTRDLCFVASSFLFSTGS